MNINPFSEAKSYTDPAAKASKSAISIAATAILWMLGFGYALQFILGCSNSGMVITLRDSSAIDVASISMEQSQWPVVSYIVGPTYYTWVRKDIPGAITIEGSATLTNTTSAIGIYSSTEAKNLDISVTYTPTNMPSVK